jgi:hypothetical protein
LDSSLSAIAQSLDSKPSEVDGLLFFAEDVAASFGVLPRAMIPPPRRNFRERILRVL